MSLSHETAVKIRNAGFPQKEIGCKDCEYAEFYDEDGSCWNTMQIAMEESSVYIPTLSELIQECGPGHLFRLANHRPIHSEDEGGWFARNEMIEGQDMPDYPTPEEAVAMLYIAINKK